MFDLFIDQDRNSKNQVIWPSWHLENLGLALISRGFGSKLPVYGVCQVCWVNPQPD